MSTEPRPTYSLVYTSARPQQVPSALELWFSRARHPERIEAVICVDRPNEAEAKAVLEGRRWAQRVRLVINTGPRTCVAGWNEAAREAGGDVMIAMSDDFQAPEEWDELLDGAGPERWWDEDRVVAVSDGGNSDLFTLPIATRRRIQRYGHLFHPAYTSLFCDTEFTAVALRDGVVIDARNLLFKHDHHSYGHRKKDDVDRLHSSNKRYRLGQQVYEARQRVNFPREWPLPDQRENPGTNADVFALYILANKDDFCLFEVCNRVLSEQAGPRQRVGAVYLFCPDEYWSGQQTPAAERNEVAAAAERLRQAWPAIQVHLVVQGIAPFRVAALNRLEVETRARNDAVAAIRAAGFQHILVIDGDELWRRGLFARLSRFIASDKPAAVQTSMIPVIGLPGYPVAGAADRATIYLGPNTYFIRCRQVCGTRRYLRGRSVIHFTGTRRTMDEIIRKHRDSGHYDDPNYAFEAWIRDTLPQVKPGMRNAHMYKPRQIWPRVRGWKQEELDEIPEAIRGYLGTELEPAGITHWLGRLIRLPWAH